MPTPLAPRGFLLTSRAAGLETGSAFVWKRSSVRLRNQQGVCRTSEPITRQALKPISPVKSAYGRCDCSASRWRTQSEYVTPLHARAMISKNRRDVFSSSVLFVNSNDSNCHPPQKGNERAITIPVGSNQGHYVTLITQRSVVQIHPPQPFSNFSVPIGSRSLPR
jgi:hypothetical protein